VDGIEVVGRIDVREALANVGKGGVVHA
jgi:hypothetical protein